MHSIGCVQCTPRHEATKARKRTSKICMQLLPPPLLSPLSFFVPSQYLDASLTLNGAEKMYQHTGILKSNALVRAAKKKKKNMKKGGKSWVTFNSFCHFPSCLYFELSIVGKIPAEQNWIAFMNLMKKNFGGSSFVAAAASLLQSRVQFESHRKSQLFSLIQSPFLQPIEKCSSYLSGKPFSMVC